MHASSRLDRKQFLMLAAASASATLLGCSAEGPADPLGGGGTGGAGTAGSGTAGASGIASGGAGTGGSGVAGGGTAGSAGAGGSAGGTSAPDCGAQLKVLITADHGHVLAITMADVMGGANKVYDTKGTSDHPHFIQLTAADFSKLQTGGTVRKLTCNDGHEHEYIINCMGLMTPETTSGVANFCDTEHQCASTNTSFCPDIVK